MTRYLVSVTTPSYLPRTGAYFNSLGLIRSAWPVTILMDFNPTTDPDGEKEKVLREAVHWTLFRHMPLPPTHSN